MTWKVNGTPNTLTVAGDDIDITDLTALKFNQFLVHTFATDGDTRLQYTLDNTEADDYAFRISVNGAADGTNASRPRWNANSATSADDTFEMMYILNLDSEEKLVIMFHMQNNGNGAGNAPDRTENVSKKDTTTDTGQFTRIDMNNDSTGNYAIDSNMSALGTN